jgi:pilus assembly protein CpaB
MSKSRVMVMGLALGSAAMAAYLANGFVGGKPTAEVVEIQRKIESEEVLVAAKQMLMGERLASGSVAWQSWPKDAVKEVMITRSEQPDAKEKLGDTRARVPMFEGEPVIDKKLVHPGQNGFMAAVLPKGFRAIAVRISEATSAGGFILPNDRVDVIMTRKLDVEGVTEKVVTSETVLTNVRVLAINQTFQQDPESGEVTVVKGETATLELNPPQTEAVSIAETAGQISLALRSMAETPENGIPDTGPVLNENFAKSEGKGQELVTVKYGVEKRVSKKF